MALSATDRATYTARLSSAEDALHRLLTGSAARVIVDQNTERVEFAVANADKLRAYIKELRIKLGLDTVNGPMNMWML